MSVRVVLIDSGLHASHPHLRDLTVRCESWEFAPGGGFVRAPLDNDALGYGTAAAILELAPRVRLISLNTFEENWTCPCEHVLCTLVFALGLDPTLVNLSLGTTEAAHAAELRTRVAEFGRRGAQVRRDRTLLGR